MSVLLLVIIRFVPLIFVRLSSNLACRLSYGEAISLNFDLFGPQMEISSREKYCVCQLKEDWCVAGAIKKLRNVLWAHHIDPVLE